MRKTKEGDLPELISLVKRVYLNLPKKSYGSLKEWNGYIKENHSFVYVKDQRVVAHSSLEIQGMFGTLARSFVDPLYERKGIYQEMIAYRIEFARKRGLLYLNTRAVTYSSKAQEILTGLYGFVPIGLELATYPDIKGIGQKESLVVLRKPLLIPDTLPKQRQNQVPFKFDGKWTYKEIPIGFDFSKIKLDQKVKEKLRITIHQKNI